MAKTELTKKYENALVKQSKDMRIFGCLEVTIGWYGKERVDYITLDYKNIWRCYEIKVTKSDFHSKAHNTFIGHMNYYVMPKELYEQIKSDIPIFIGVKTLDEYGSIQCLKQARQQTVSDKMERILSNSLIRCLCRDRDKLLKEIHMIREDCKYWQSSCDLCGITGDEKCKRKCEDYESVCDYDDGSDDWD